MDKGTTDHASIQFAQFAKNLHGSCSRSTTSSAARSSDDSRNSQKRNRSRSPANPETLANAKPRTIAKPKANTDPKTNANTDAEADANPRPRYTDADTNANPETNTNRDPNTKIDPNTDTDTAGGNNIPAKRIRSVVLYSAGWRPRRRGRARLPPEGTADPTIADVAFALGPRRTADLAAGKPRHQL